MHETRGKRTKDDPGLRKERANRLKQARREAGYSSARKAAQKMQVCITTYEAHEHGRIGFANTADKYATSYNVTLDWLWSGKGTMKPSPIVEKFEQLSPAKKALLLALADSWTD